MIRVMSFNLKTDNLLNKNSKWKKRSKVVYDVLDKYNCDIIGTQEVNNEMYSDLTSNVDDYEIIGSPRTRKFFMERNNILIRNDHKMLSHETFWISNKPDKEYSSIWYSLFPRICTTAVIDFKEEGKVRIYNTHLDCLFPKARAFGLKKIMEHIEKNHDKEKLPIILTGDFNAPPNSKVIKDLNSNVFSKRKLVAIQDTKKELYDSPTFRNGLLKKINVHIDYIYVSEEFNIKHGEIVKYSKDDVYPSDHYPLMAEIELKK